MYTDEDLSAAVKANILSAEAVSQFRTFVAKQQNTTLVDEEHFRLVSSFNDFFVVIACILVLISVAWLGASISHSVAGLALAATAWGLAEFFVLRRKMALPAIVLLITFIVGSAWFAGVLFFQSGNPPSMMALMVAGATAAIAAWLHWLRFQVPITVAAGVAAVITAAIAIASYHFPQARAWTYALFLIGGMTTFMLAMYWDAQDKKRQTRKTDVAFWLHLVAAPLIVHPIFSMLGVLSNQGNAMVGLIVMVLYTSLAAVSIAIDRRALMVSALVYVLFSFTSLFNTYGVMQSGFAVTGVMIGSMLLLLSAFWHGCRARLLALLPTKLQMYLPPLK